MTCVESRQLKEGDRVFWLGDANNQGTVNKVSWSGVTIDWDDGDCTSISHDNMDRIALINRGCPDGECFLRWARYSLQLGLAPIGLLAIVGPLVVLLPSFSPYTG
jgi:hypothetical protein